MIYKWSSNQEKTRKNNTLGFFTSTSWMKKAVPPMPFKKPEWAVLTVLKDKKTERPSKRADHPRKGSQRRDI